MTIARAAELLLLTLLATAASAVLAWGQGQYAWSWDALNHHIYLGLIAEHPRWDLDVIPASYQSYQYPYLYWPVYKLSQWEMPAATLGAVWAGFQAACLLPPLWFVCLRLLPDQGSRLGGAMWRAAGCAMGALSLVLLASLQTTANDALATVPLLWAIAVGLQDKPTDRQAFLAAALWGISVACKLSNGIYIFWLLLWWWMPLRPHWPLRRGLALAMGAISGFGIAYAPWGLQLWRVTGNPFYPNFLQFFGAH